MAVLAESQFELATVVFGWECPIEVTDVAFGAPDIEAGDRPNPARDGTAFGRDRHRGSVLTFELATNAQDAAAALASWNTLASAWTDAALRTDPRAVTPLRLRSWGGQPRVVYGRPRTWEPASTQQILAGVTAHVAEFQTADSTYYSDTEHTRTLTLAPELSGGFTFPVVYPVQLAPVSTSGSNRITNAGDRRTWPVVVFHGPIVNPAVTWLSTGVRFSATTTLAADQSLTIDTRPWALSVLRTDGASLRGVCSPVPMRHLGLPPGDTVVQLSGQDQTGTSSCVLTWRDAYTTPGGTP